MGQELEGGPRSRDRELDCRYGRDLGLGLLLLRREGVYGGT